MEKTQEITKSILNKIVRLTDLCIANDKSINDNYQLVLKELNLQNIGSDLTKNIYGYIEAKHCTRIYERCVLIDLQTFLKTKT